MANIADSRLTQNGRPDPTSSDSSRAESFRSASSLKPDETTTTSSQTTQAEREPEEPEVNIPTNGPLHVPLRRPSPKAKLPKPADLTPEQETKYATVLASVSQWQSLPATTAKNAPQAPIQDHERMWLTRECLLRYLRATKWITPNALKRLQSTLSWRREYGADNFTADYISPENETGKQVVLGFDNDTRPCLYLNPGKQNTKMSDRQIHHLSYMLDRVIDFMPPGQETSCLIINFKGAASGTVPTVGQARQVLNILQGHNPERLGRALINELPWYVSTFFKLISPFIDPVTKEKMKFNEDCRKWVPAEQLWTEAKGDLEFEYEHAEYWPAMAAECEKRQKTYRARWERAGKRIGEYEEYLRGGDHKSITQVLESAGVENSKPGSVKSDADLAAAGVAKMTV